MNSDQTVSGELQAAFDQKRIHLLEMIEAGKPVKEALKELVLFVESHTDGMICTILLLDPKSRCVFTGAAPNLPEGLSAAIDGSAIGPKAGSCGTAAFRGENVFAEDIETDPLWADYKNVFLLNGLRSCWSSPFFDSRHHVLGTCAIYGREPGLPTKQQHDLLNIATEVASACIAAKRKS